MDRLLVALLVSIVLFSLGYWIAGLFRNQNSDGKNELGEQNWGEDILSDVYSLPIGCSGNEIEGIVKPFSKNLEEHVDNDALYKSAAIGAYRPYHAQLEHGPLIRGSPKHRDFKTINPWELEYEPNPVIFPWLRGFHIPGFNQKTQVDEDATNLSSSSVSAIVLPSSVEQAQRSYPTNAPEHSCPECGVAFSTGGQKRKHVNRKHRKRYKCGECDAAFNLNADLRRHSQNVHRDLIDDTKREYKCSNDGCLMPDKVFFRKDNFERHLRRCRVKLAERQEDAVQN